MIEIIQRIRLVNREMHAKTISSAAKDRRRASVATAGINSWIAVWGITDKTKVPDEVVAKILT